MSIPYLFNSPSSLFSPDKNYKDIKDYIYHDIRIPCFFFKFIDTSQFQRLRDLYQHPTAQYVYPSATHRRFEHSLGTFHLAHEYMENIEKNQLNFSNKEIVFKIPIKIKNSVLICGLCHNLGFGPFGQAFDDFCREDLHLSQNEYDYRYRGVNIFENILHTQGIDPESPVNEEQQFDLNLVKNIISCNTKSTKYYEQIVNNNLNGIDVNLFDSLNRNSYKFGFLKQGFDYKKFMHNAYLVDDNIWFREENALLVYELFKSKYYLSKDVYYHRVSSGIELMHRDILREANNVYNFSSVVSNIEAFMVYNDFNIISQIYRSNNPNLSKAKHLVDRIYKRDNYKFIGEYDTSSSTANIDDFTEETLLNFTKSDNGKLSRDDIRIMKIKINLGIDENDPIKNVKFYNNKYKLVDTNNESVSNMTPRRTQENIIRVYLTEKDETKHKVAQNALKEFCKEKGGSASFREKKEKTKFEFKIPNFSNMSE